MKQWKELARRPAEAVAPRTLVEIWGKTRVLVERHRGILGYGAEEIVVGATFGMIRVTGKDLRLCCMSREQLFISGTIENVRLEGKE